MKNILKNIPGPLSVAWVVITAALLILLKIQNPTAVENIQLKGFDTLLSSDTIVQSDDVVIIDIGEASMARLGQWPWDRRELAQAIQRINELGASTIVVPILMTERDRLGGDTDLAKTLSKTPSVIAQSPTTQNKKPDAVRRGVAAIGGDPYIWLFKWPGAISPRPELAQASKGVGTTIAAPEVDGVVRRMPLVVTVNKEYYPSLAIEALRVFTGEQSYQMKMSDAGVEKVRIAGQPVVDTDANGRVWLRWNKEFKHYELGELSRKDANLKGKIVVLGLAVEGLGGIIATPRGETWAHNLQANAIQTLLDGDSPTRPAWANIVELLVIIAITALVIFAMPRVPMWAVGLVLVGTLGAIVQGGLVLWSKYSQLWDIYYLVFASTLLYGHALFARFVQEFKQKQQIKKQFGTYLSPALVAKLQKNPELLQLGGDERELSIMFTDVRGFTTISEHYGKDVQGLTKIMNRYMTAMTRRIIDNNGTLDKYIGDAQMAFWNAPVTEIHHAHMAVKTALEMMDSLDEFNKEVTAEGVPAFGMGLGINTAAVVVGNMGSDQRFDYTCLGDGVNLASRLEGQSKPYGVKIVLGQRTAELVSDTYKVVELDNIAVKGKTQGVKIFTLGITNPTLHDTYLQAYYRGDWARAIKQCEKLIKEDTELTKYYEAMLERMNEGLPANWDGTYRATSK
ncbi:CHD domain containing protein [uncultured Caudovirales phage]|uniref:CHD domain containing protein n=1 Tax=uncultured Caudovirales phage TaxID=2100421 RepID=A0A6J5TD21_9CAUD|nr:CHD domain containing protein [uncultured Caudovirales phage]